MLLQCHRILGDYLAELRARVNHEMEAMARAEEAPETQKRKVSLAFMVNFPDLQPDALALSRAAVVHLDNAIGDDRVTARLDHRHPVPFATSNPFSGPWAVCVTTPTSPNNWTSRMNTSVASGLSHQKGGGGNERDLNMDAPPSPLPTASWTWSTGFYGGAGRTIL